MIINPDSNCSMYDYMFNILDRASVLIDFEYRRKWFGLIDCPVLSRLYIHKLLLYRCNEGRFTLK